MQHIDRPKQQEPTMNMNTTRLDDQLNSLIVAAAVFGVLLTSALNFQASDAAEAQIAQASRADAADRLRHRLPLNAPRPEPGQRHCGADAGFQPLTDPM
ncbi:MAG: hypothetical protein QM722_11785 [Piscinibacter sp.]